MAFLRNKRQRVKVQIIFFFVLFCFRALWWCIFSLSLCIAQHFSNVNANFPCGSATRTPSVFLFVCAILWNKRANNEKSIVIFFFSLSSQQQMWIASLLHFLYGTHKVQCYLLHGTASSMLKEFKNTVIKIHVHIPTIYWNARKKSREKEKKTNKQRPKRGTICARPEWIRKIAHAQLQRE